MKPVILVLCCGAMLIACSKPQETTPTTQASADPPQAEIADAKYVEIGKQGIAALSAGDVDAWMNTFADSARYYWNYGDSMVGKQAIADYWKDRRGNVIEKIEFNNDIWLPVKVNRTQKGPDREGVWLMCWYQVTSAYKGGGTMTQWVHTALHFDDSDKVDVVVQYLDRAAIGAALPKAK